MQCPGTMTTHSLQIRIDANHPALPGHFPGWPVVPGVLLLDRTIAAAEAWLGRELHVVGLPQVKFTMPLLPDETATVDLALGTGELRFEIRRAEDRIAQGVLKLAEEPAR